MSEPITSAWWQNILVPIVKGKGGIKEYNNYTGIKPRTHTFNTLQNIIG